jgi:thioesterase domain-containing protein
LESGYHALKENQEDKIKAIASHYVNELLSLLPSANYILGGYSFGSLVIYEIAKQLEKKGKSISILLILDYYPLLPFWDFVLEFPHTLKLTLRQLFSKSHHEKRAQLTTLVSDRPKPYIIKGYSGKIQLILASKFIYRWSRLKLLVSLITVWNQHLLEQVYWIPGNHHDMIQEPYVKLLADKLTILFKTRN